MKKTGIDAISFYVPELYVSLEDLSKARGIPFEKLKKGLGLDCMSVPDLNEDAASFAANALLKLIETNDLDPNEIGRVYLGTESAVDGSKPTATYALGAVENILSKKYGPRCFKHCDVVDLTFACVGAVDALQNCIDWVQNGSDRKAVVIASDLSKYELNSTGEYTQGAGAVAVLVTQDPQLIAIDINWGIATKSVGDFFKPRRTYSKQTLAKDLLQNVNGNFTEAELNEFISQTNSGFWTDSSELVELFKEEPVFDGQYSNQCYSERITEALEHFHTQKPTNFLRDWDYLIFHLPYAYHGRRIILSNWLEWIKAEGKMDALIAEIGSPTEDFNAWSRAAAKSEMYQAFVANKIEHGERASSAIGNMYTASIFMSLLSLASVNANSNNDLTNKKIGFIAYGSGSKSKIFEGCFQANWEKKIAGLNLFETLERRSRISVATYEQLHKRTLQKPVKENADVALREIETTVENRLGLRNYAK